MKSGAPRKKIKIGIAGCGAIGSRMARSITKYFTKECQLTGVYDIIREKAIDLENYLGIKGLTKRSLKGLIKDCDLMVEAVVSKQTRAIIREALVARKDVLTMSVGQLLKAKGLFKLAASNHCTLVVPSGAIAGIDAVKAASLVNLRKITLTTRKPPMGFINNYFLIEKGIDLSKITKETVLFEGGVEEAIKIFPQNINVAATIALANQSKSKLRIRLMTSPEWTTNSHEIEMEGDFGKMVTRTENVPCPDNPKTSYLAVLSGIQTLKQYVTGMRIGT